MTVVEVGQLVSQLASYGSWCMVQIWSRSTSSLLIYFILLEISKVKYSGNKCMGGLRIPPH